MRGKLINGFILLVTLFPFSQSFAQQKSNYLQQWRKVDSLAINKGLTQSALVEVNKIYAAAKKEKNEVQVIKALLYRMDLQEQTEEESPIKNIKQLETEIANSSQPSASILKSILAENYWTYFQQNRYELYNRTKTTNFKKEDIATWDIEDFHKKITALYLESISNEKMLRATRLEAFDPIIVKGNMRYLRPTLFDLLAHRALEYFKNDERYLDKPAYAYEIDDPTAFADAKTFAAYNFKTSDSFSLHHKALVLFQRLINFHLRDIKPAALVDADIERISFVNSNGVMADKDSLYEQSLQVITNKYPTERETAQAWYLIAEIHASSAREYDPLKDTSNRYEFITARKICEQVIANKDSSKGKSNCINLLNEILRKEAFLKTEKVNVPGVPFRTLVSYKNISQVSFRLIRIDKVSKDSFGNYWEEKYWSSLLKLPAIKSFSQAVPQTNDHQVHRTEIKIDPLPVGEYALLLAGSPELSTSEKSLAVQFFYVSNLAYINNDKDYFVLSRQEGMPLENVSIQLWGRKYDYQLRKYIDTKREV